MIFFETFMIIFGLYDVDVAAYMMTEHKSYNDFEYTIFFSILECCGELKNLSLLEFSIYMYSQIL